MRPTLKCLSAACASSLLFACADLGQHPPAYGAAAHVAGSADDAYYIGRQQHLAGRYPLATASYQSALRADPAHVNARNGLATLYAEQGEFGKAISLWEQLTRKAAAAPSTAFLYSNLGYAYFLNAEYEHALAALERACVLDPLNYRAWRNLGSALEKLGQDARAQLMYKQADALEAHDFKTDYVLAQRNGVAAIDSAVAADPAPAQDGWVTSEVRQSANGMFELHRGKAPAPRAANAAPAAVAPPVVRVAAAPAVAPFAESEPESIAGAQPELASAVPMPVPEPEVASEPPLALAQATDEIAKLEIRNGNGVTGMARSLARKMGDASLRVVRLSNQKGFNVAHTRVEYQGPFREAANRLAERFGNATVLEVENCKSADVRLVIGRDLIRSKTEARRIIRAALARAAVARSS